MLALVACGGSGSATPNKEQYDAKLSRLCLVAADQLRELHVDNGVAAWRADGPRIVAIERRFNRKLAALKPPESIGAVVAAYTSANDRGFRATQDAVNAAKAGDAKRLQAALKQANKDNLATRPPAKKIGAAGCYISYRVSAVNVCLEVPLGRLRGSVKAYGYMPEDGHEEHQTPDAAPAVVRRQSERQPDQEDEVGERDEDEKRHPAAAAYRPQQGNRLPDEWDERDAWAPHPGPFSDHVRGQTKQAIEACHQANRRDPAGHDHG